MVLSTGRNCWDNPRLKGTRTNNHKPICKELAGKKAVSYTQLEDVKDKSFLTKMHFLPYMLKRLTSRGPSIAAVNLDVRKTFNTLQNYVFMNRKSIHETTAG